MSVNWYILPDVAAGGVFSRKAVQDDVYYSINNGVQQANTQELAMYNNQWATYKAAMDNTPGGTTPPPMPGLLNVAVRDSDNNPGWQVMDGKDAGTSLTYVVSPYTYIPPKFAAPSPLPTEQNEITAPAGDIYPEGWIVVDPSGTPWYKHWGTSPFLTGRTIFQPGQTPSDPKDYLNMYMTKALYDQATGKVVV